jgi:Ser/Thr protein kinase RdoA (MazF antagonist)
MSDAPRYEVYLAGETVKLLVVLDYVQGTRWKEKRREDWARRIGVHLGLLARPGSGCELRNMDCWSAGPGHPGKVDRSANNGTRREWRAGK